ncbi:hypothetical protein EW145_g2559 [Phellinidium pouzarii]|uniref:pyruvate dehydrogenase (acetyl-transferring) n=1 Tax=Phellinidium pouzarii TaxID=167371 RepID=A0A4S4LAB7_9AGAM|nr:hypothetical protein EW145_g2559 [Phellinidium pouzarii]
MSVRDALNTAMEEMLRDESVFIMGKEIARYNGRRVIDTPITEISFASVTVGATRHVVRRLASRVYNLVDGLHGEVECHKLTTWRYKYVRDYEQLTSLAQAVSGDVPCPVVFRGPNGAAAGVGAQHSQDYASWYGQIPGLTVVSPWSAEDCKGLLKAAIRDPNPVVFLENEMMYGVTFPVSQEVMSDNFLLPIGKAKVELEGSDVTIVAHSKMVTHSLEAAQELAKEGIKAEVINLRSIRPLDIDSIKASVKKTNRLIIVEGGFPAFGVGSEICAQIVESEAFDYLDAPVERVTGADVPTPYAADLEDLTFPDTPLIVNLTMRGLMQSLNRLIYGLTPEEKIRAWQSKIRMEERQLDREMRQLDMARKKAQGQVKQLAAKGRVDNARMLTKELVRSNKQKDRLSVSKARLGSINIQLAHQLSMVKVTGTLQKSTEIMKLSNSLIKLPQISQSMREMSMEMMKAGILEEMLDDVMEMDDDEELEEEANAEVEKVLYEITDGKLGAARAVKDELPHAQDAVDEDEERNLEQYQKQLSDLLSG